jgi:hypothetical protein
MPFMRSAMEGQFVTVIPSHELVVVRLGLVLDPVAWNHEAFIHDLLAALDVDT